MNRQLPLYRKKEDGKYVKVVIEFDESRNIVSEVESPDDRASPTLWVDSEVKTDDRGNKIVARAGPIDQKAISVFLSSIPCSSILPDAPAGWCEECEDIRERYRKEVEKVGGPNCTSCQLGGIKRKFLPEIQSTIKKYYHV